MRTIKFRGKRLDNGEWVYGFLTCYTEKVAAIQHWDKKGNLTGYGTDPESVGQWTGLVDKNGKEIFEGDVIKKGLYNPDTLKVEFLNGWFGVFNEGGTRLLQFTEECVEVIGNIHDNPELMEVE